MLIPFQSILQLIHRIVLCRKRREKQKMMNRIELNWIDFETLWNIVNCGQRTVNSGQWTVDSEHWPKLILQLAHPFSFSECLINNKYFDRFINPNYGYFGLKAYYDRENVDNITEWMNEWNIYQIIWNMRHVLIVTTT